MTRQLTALRNSDCGSVLMEYLILLVFVGAVLSVASTQLFYSYVPTDDGKGGTTNFGPLGRQLQGFYQRTMGGIALPIP